MRHASPPFLALMLTTGCGVTPVAVPLAEVDGVVVLKERTEPNLLTATFRLDPLSETECAIPSEPVFASLNGVQSSEPWPRDDGSEWEAKCEHPRWDFDASPLTAEPTLKLVIWDSSKTVFAEYEWFLGERSVRVVSPASGAANTGERVTLEWQPKEDRLQPSFTSVYFETQPSDRWVGSANKEVLGNQIVVTVPSDWTSAKGTFQVSAGFDVPVLDCSGARDCERVRLNLTRSTGAVTVNGTGGSSPSSNGAPNSLPCASSANCGSNALAQGRSLYGVWGSGPTDVWVVGDVGTTLHWNGYGWTASRRETPQALLAVWGSSASDVWGVGTHGTIRHWTGSVWSAIPSPTDQSLRSVWGSGPGDVWAVGDQGVILHWNGISWSLYPSPSSNTLRSVWGMGQGYAWAVGDRGTKLSWNGSAWTSQGTTGIDPLLGVFGSNRNDVWLVGGAGTLIHWSGISWTTYPVSSLSLNGAWANPSGDAWVVGDNGTVLHRSGGSWSAGQTTSRTALYAVWGSGGAVWAVGLNGTILQL